MCRFDTAIKIISYILDERRKPPAETTGRNRQTIGRQQTDAERDETLREVQSRVIGLFDNEHLELRSVRSAVIDALGGFHEVGCSCGWDIDKLLRIAID